MIIIVKGKKKKKKKKNPLSKDIEQTHLGQGPLSSLKERQA